MSEFDLIAALLEELGDNVDSADTVLGPGDDCAITRVPDEHELVSSIDTLVADVHFPAAAPPELIGFRALCVSFSDVAAMGARPAFATIAVTLPTEDEAWLRGFARGVARASQRFGSAVIGGNLARGPLNVSVSAHGYVRAGTALRRSGAAPGDRLFVGGVVGAGAAALDREDLLSVPLGTILELDEGDARYPLRRYYAPEPDFGLAARLSTLASAAIDLSDGLLAVLGHLCKASGVGVRVDLDEIPCHGNLGRAMTAGDDYLLCFALPAKSLEPLQTDFPWVAMIGEFTADRSIRDGQGAILDSDAGFDHFREG
jgi:thiamine-monophosphate kinase